MGYLVLGAVLAGSIAALVLALRSRQKAIRQAKAAEAKTIKIAREMSRMQEAYREETRKLLEMGIGTDDERFHASLDILHDLSADG